jgi:hypothetical protein
MWSFTPCENSGDWQAAAILSARLLEAYTAIGAAPPKGFKCTSHNLRKGADSLASCIGASLHVVKYMGGWAKNNSVTEGNTSTPPWPHLQRRGITSVGSSQPDRFSKTRLRKPSALKYWKNVPTCK